MPRYAENLESGAASIEENVEAVISEESEEVSRESGMGAQTSPHQQTTIKRLTGELSHRAVLFW